MTLDEAIEHCNEEAKKECKLGNNECAEEHIQLHDWLVELRDYKHKDKIKRCKTMTDKIICENKYLAFFRCCKLYFGIKHNFGDYSIYGHKVNLISWTFGHYSLIFKWNKDRVKKGRSGTS